MSHELNSAFFTSCRIDWPAVVQPPAFFQSNHLLRWRYPAFTHTERLHHNLSFKRICWLKGPSSFIIKVKGASGKYDSLGVLVRNYLTAPSASISCFENKTSNKVWILGEVWWEREREWLCACIKMNTARKVKRACPCVLLSAWRPVPSIAAAACGTDWGQPCDGLQSSPIVLIPSSPPTSWQDRSAALRQRHAKKSLIYFKCLYKEADLWWKQSVFRRIFACTHGGSRRDEILHSKPMITWRAHVLYSCQNHIYSQLKLPYSGDLILIGKSHSKMIDFRLRPLTKSTRKVQIVPPAVNFSQTLEVK